MSEDRCIYCGEYVPEGRQVCLACSREPRNNVSQAEINMIKWLSTASNKDITKVLNDTEKFIFGEVLA